MEGNVENPERTMKVRVYVHKKKGTEIGQAGGEWKKMGRYWIKRVSGRPGLPDSVRNVSREQGRKVVSKRVQADRRRG